MSHYAVLCSGGDVGFYHMSEASSRDCQMTSSHEKRAFATSLSW